MKPSPLLLMLDALLGLVEQRLDRDFADPAADLPLIGAQLQRLTGLLVRFTERSAAQPRDEISPAIIEAILASRRLRAQHFGAKVGEAGWTLLLVLYAARLERRSSSATRLSAMAGLRLTTSFRWLHILQQRG